MAFAIERAAAGDAPALAELHVRSWQAAYAAILPASYLQSLQPAERLPMWQRALAAAQPAVLVARAASGAAAGPGGALLGFVSHGPCRDDGAPASRGEIWSLYLAPQAWGCGAGRALLQAALAELQHGGCADCLLWVLQANTRGRRFYEAAGFAAVAGSERSFELGGQPLAEIAYLRRLDPPPR